MDVGVNRSSSDISDEVRCMFEMVNISVLTSFFCILGLFSNLINIIVFYKQGLKSTVNISFMALSITDLINVILLQWVSISSYSLLLNSPDIVIFPKEVSYYTSGMPHACVARITAWITVYITAERCLCIASPFMVKRCITVKRTTLAMIFIYVANILQLIPEYLLFTLDFKNFTQMNVWKLGLVIRSDYIHLEGLTVLIYSISMIISFLAVIGLTLNLIIQLKRMTKWRQNSKIKNEQAKRFTSKEKMVVRTVVVVALFLILTFTPSFIMCGVVYIVPGMSLNGPLSNIYISSISFTFLFDSINASASAVLYYIINKNYRETFTKVFFPISMKSLKLRFKFC
ncbi:Endothelin-converting enzyme 2 [Biomphalaria glabrata]|nr:FMRFamide receptor-like [Biomphalaria glabrata]